MTSALDRVLPLAPPGTGPGSPPGSAALPVLVEVVFFLVAASSWSSASTDRTDPCAVRSPDWSTVSWTVGIDKMAHIITMVIVDSEESSIQDEF